MLVQLLNMRRLEEEGESRLGKEKEEPSTATFLFCTNSICTHELHLDYIVCVNILHVCI